MRNYFLHGGCTEDGENLYAKIILSSKKETDMSQKISCNYNWNRFDFSTEIILKLNGRSLNDCCINIQVKRASRLAAKSMLIYNQSKIINRYFQTLFLVKLILAQNLPALAFNTEMTDNPEHRIFKWHDSLSSP